MPKFQIHASFEVPIMFTHYARVKVDAENEAEAMAKLNAMTPAELKAAIRAGLGTVDRSDSIEFDPDAIVSAIESGNVASASSIEVED